MRCVYEKLFLNVDNIRLDYMALHFCLLLVRLRSRELDAIVPGGHHNNVEVLHAIRWNRVGLAKALDADGQLVRLELHDGDIARLQALIRPVVCSFTCSPAMPIGPE